MNTFHIFVAFVTGSVVGAWWTTNHPKKFLPQDLSSFMRHAQQVDLEESAYTKDYLTKECLKHGGNPIVSTKRVDCAADPSKESK